MFIRRVVYFFASKVRVTTPLPAALLFCGFCLLWAGCATSRTERPASSGVEISWGVVTNTADGFVSELILHNRGEQVLPGGGWSLYFNFLRPIDTESVSPTVSIEHLNGDFYRLTPTDEFGPIGPGSRHRVTFDAGAWSISESDAPAGFYFVWDDREAIESVGEPAVRPFEEARQTRRGAGDRLAVETAAHRYEANAALYAIDVSAIPRILPRPARIDPRPGTVAVGTDLSAGEGLEREAAYLAGEIERLLGTSGEAGAAIVLETDASLGPEAYRLVVDEPIRITGGDAAGVFYGIQSLRALFPSGIEADAMPRVLLSRVVVDDAPRFPYRGMHLDVARNFHEAETVKRLLDLMAAYKLNRFHFHLTDDEGWRLAIEELPELTEVGARRGHTLTEEEHLQPSLGSGPATDRSSGFYTREAFKDLLQYARDRHIEVIPEIDLPGHARAAIVAMEARTRRTGSGDYQLVDPLDASTYESVQMYDDNVVNVCLPSTYRFIETVVDDVAAMYREAGVPFRSVHVGGDEVPEGAWERSPACRTFLRESRDVEAVADLHDHFLRRVDAILDRHGLVTAGWEEIALTERDGEPVPNPAFLDAGFRPHVWNAVWGWGAEDTVYRLANAGYDVVISNASTFYFDLAYAKHPEEPGFYWGGFVDTKAPFAFIPFDLYRSADRDLMGAPIPAGAYDDATRLTLAGRERVLGLQGQLWSETVKTGRRLEYMIFPRLISLAERAWAERPDWALLDDPARRRTRLDADWNVFANALGRRELPRLDRLGVRYRIPPPGAVIEDGLLRANVALPGLTIRYTTDGSEPDRAAAVFTGPVAVQETVKLRTFTTNDRGSRTVVVEP